MDACSIIFNLHRTVIDLQQWDGPVSDTWHLGIAHAPISSEHCRLEASIRLSCPLLSYVYRLALFSPMTALGFELTLWLLRRELLRLERLSAALLLWLLDRRCWQSVSCDCDLAKISRSESAAHWDFGVSRKVGKRTIWLSGTGRV